MTETQQPAAKTKRKAKPAAKKAAAPAKTAAQQAAETKRDVDASLAKLGNSAAGARAGAMPPVEEGRKRYFVDLQARHGEWLERYAALLTKEKRRPMSPADALEHIIRNTYAIDPTKAGLTTGVTVAVGASPILG